MATVIKHKGSFYVPAAGDQKVEEAKQDIGKVRERVKGAIGLVHEKKWDEAAKLLEELLKDLAEAKEDVKEEAKAATFQKNGGTPTLEQAWMMDTTRSASKQPFYIDEEEGKGWCVYGSESGYCYSTFEKEEDAARDAAILQKLKENQDSIIKRLNTRKVEGQLKTAIPIMVEDIGFLPPRLRKKMGAEMATIFEDVGRAALEKVKNRATDVIAEEIAAFSDDLAKRIKDDLGKKGIDTAAEYIPTWAESVATEVLSHASENVTEKIVSKMQEHFPVADKNGKPRQASIIKFNGSLYVPTK